MLMETVTFTGVSAYVENRTAKRKGIDRASAFWYITKVVIALREPHTEILRQTDIVAILSTAK